MENREVTTRLVINLRDGIVEAEGGEDFVRSIYDDFKERVSKPVILSSHLKQLTLGEESTKLDGEDEPHKKRARKSRNADTSKAKSGDYRPEFNTQLNLGKLEEFYDQFEPSNNFEKILIFAVFLRDQLKIAPCTANDVYSCFFTLKNRTKTPEAFVQAFRDAQSRSHFIEFASPQTITVTIAGDNHFNQKLTRKGIDE